MRGLFSSTTFALSLLLPPQDRPAPPPPAAEAKAREIPGRAEGAALIGEARAQEKVEVLVEPLAPEDAPGLVAIPDQVVQQFEQQLRPILRGNLHLLRMVCDPTDEELRGLAEAGEETLRSTALLLARRQATQNRLAAGPIDPIGRLSWSLAEAAEAVLSADRIAPFLAELEAREEARKSAGAGVFVAVVDQAVLLDSDQRERLHRGLVGAWEEAWYPVVELVQRQPKYLPQLPGHCLAEVLDERQLQIWKGRSRSTTRINGLLFFGPTIDNSALASSEEGIEPAERVPAIAP